MSLFLPPSILGRCSSRIVLFRPNFGPFAQCLGSSRNLPARGTKPLPRYLWDEKHLKKITDDEYTHKPLRVNKLGGRHPDTGRKVNQHIGGGVKFDYFMVDIQRRGPTEPDSFYEERVLEVRRDPNRTAHIALVVGSKKKRWILATENMVAGQVIRTTEHIPKNPATVRDGDAHPLGALSSGTLINCIERYPGHGGDFITGAGAAAEVVRHQGDFVVIRAPYKHEYALHKTCVATIGRLSHSEYHELQYGSAQMHRRFGYKMSSGLWHKKDGYLGRKIRRPPPIKTWDTPPPPSPLTYSVTLSKGDLSAAFGNAQVHILIQAGFTGRIYPD